jgi:hypothetical protein
MAIGNLNGGTTVGTTGTSNYFGIQSSITIPTGAVDYKGDYPVLVTSIRAYLSGVGQPYVRFKSNGYQTDAFIVANGTTPTLTSYKVINAVYNGPGTYPLSIVQENGTQFNYGYGTSVGNNIVSVFADGTAVPGGILQTDAAISGNFNYYFAAGVSTLTVTQDTSGGFPTNSVIATWTTPSGALLTGYRLEYTVDASWDTYDFVDLGLVNTTQITTLATGYTYYFRISAKNQVTDLANSWGAYSTVKSLQINAIAASLDGWTSSGTYPNITRTLSREKLGPVAFEGYLGYGLTVKSVVSTAVAGTAPANTFNINKTVTGLTIGKTYRFHVGYELGGYSYASGIEPTYTLEVTGFTPSAANTAYYYNTGWDKWGNYVDFTATSTSHVLKINLTSTINTGTVGTKEWTVFPNISLDDITPISPYYVQDTVFEGSMAQHFDLATRSGGANWWVDRFGVTQFNYGFIGPSIAKFTDSTTSSTDLHYLDIEYGSDTRNFVNSIAIKNVGAVPKNGLGFASTTESQNADQYDNFETTWVVSDTALVTDYGTRRVDVTTNIALGFYDQNLCWNPRFDNSTNNWGRPTSATTSQLNRVLITKVNTGANHYLSSGATAPTAVGGSYCGTLRIITAIAAGTYIYTATGSVVKDGTETGQEGFPVVAGTQYYASIYARAGVNDATGVNARVSIRWFSANGRPLSTHDGAANSIAFGSWTQYTATAVAPAGAAYAQLRLGFVNSATGLPVDAQFYFTGALLGETGYTFFDGNKADTTTAIYQWVGDKYASASLWLDNDLELWGQSKLSSYPAPTFGSISKITWNAKESFDIAYVLDIGTKINIEYQGINSIYRIVGLQHKITAYDWFITMEVQGI